VAGRTTDRLGFCKLAVELGEEERIFVRRRHRQIDHPSQREASLRKRYVTRRAVRVDEVLTRFMDVTSEAAVGYRELNLHARGVDLRVTLHAVEPLIGHQLLVLRVIEEEVRHGTDRPIPFHAFFPDAVMALHAEWWLRIVLGDITRFDPLVAPLAEREEPAVISVWEAGRGLYLAEESDDGGDRHDPECRKPAMPANHRVLRGASPASRPKPI
jgi:hypothetical protein